LAPQANGGSSALPKDAIRVAIGVAALGWAAREMMKTARRPTILGIKAPDLHKLAKQVGDAADRLERTSEDVRNLSQQAKRFSKKLA
jgi:hypothetical protein